MRMWIQNPVIIIQDLGMDFLVRISIHVLVIRPRIKMNHPAITIWS